jgi:hypothetical protein
VILFDGVWRVPPAHPLKLSLRPGTGQHLIKKTLPQRPIECSAIDSTIHILTDRLPFFFPRLILQAHNVCGGALSIVLHVGDANSDILRYKDFGCFHPFASVVRKTRWLPWAVGFFFAAPELAHPASGRIIRSRCPVASRRESVRRPVAGGQTNQTHFFAGDLTISSYATSENM